MIIMKSNLLLFLLAISLCGCGDLRKKFSRLDSDSLTTVQIMRPNIAGMHTSAVLDTGLMIYAANIDQPFRRGAKLFPTEANQLTWQIPSGKYQFFAVGWQGGVNGTLYCGLSDAVILSGSARTVGITVSSNNCLSPPFGEAAHGTAGQPYDVLVVSCNIVVGGKAPPDNCIGNAGTAQRVRVDVPEFHSFNGKQIIPDNVPSIASACLDPSTGGHIPMAIKVPTGSTGIAPLLTRIREYDIAADCASNNTPSRTYYFHRGLANYHQFGINHLLRIDGFESPAFGFHIKAESDLSSNFFVFLKDF